MTPSKYQQAIYDEIRTGDGCLIIKAVAGAGKTTTIVEAYKLIPPTQCIFVAFNKDIVTALKGRVANACTMNSLGYGVLRRFLGSKWPLQVESDKTMKVIKRVFGEQIPDEIEWRKEFSTYAAGVRKLVGLAKAHGIVPMGVPGTGLVMDTEQNWADLIEKYDVEFERDGKPEAAIDWARRILIRSIRAAQEDLYVDFDDQLYLPVIWQAKFDQHDVIFVDEAQDVNPIQRAMLKMALKPGGRLIAVGDPHQAIYGFRGADTEAIQNIKEEFAAKELPLSVSYRCPKSVVTEAKTYVTEIESHDTAPDGKVETMDSYWPDLFTNDDAVICRNTAPLIEQAYRFIRTGKGCRMLGREIGAGLVAMINKVMGKRIKTVDQLEDKLAEYAEREKAKLMAKGKEDQAGALMDKLETIDIFVQQLPEDDRTIERLIANIEAMFTDNNKGLLTLCTIHKSKGQEWNKVFILNRHLMPSKYARQEWQKQQEANCAYVAVTRAKEELYFIDSKKWLDKKPDPKKEEKTDEVTCDQKNCKSAVL